MRTAVDDVHQMCIRDSPWPMCGEIDIMEEVGVVPNEVSSSIHTQDYHHTIGTKKTNAMTIEQAEENFISML